MRWLLVVAVIGCSRDPKPAAGPTLEPAIGTRNEEDGPLTRATEIDEEFPRLVGCDLAFAGVADGSEIELVWLWKPVRITESPTVVNRAIYRVAAGERAPKRASVERVVDPSTGKNALGSYECVWTLGARGASARLVVRGPAA